MNRRQFVAAGLSLPATVSGSIPANRGWARPPRVPNKISDACAPVGYSAQSLAPGCYLGRRFDINFRTGLLNTIDFDDYLKGYEKQPNMPPGEYLGKFMQALSRMYLITGEAAARERLDRVVQVWLRVQSGDGWLGSAQRFKSWDIWEHKYVLLGLTDYYALTGEEAALKAADRVGGFLLRHLGPGLGSILQSGHWALGSASILEAMVYLHRYTGEERYLRFCEYILEELEGPRGPRLIGILTTGSRRVCDIEDPWANRAAREVRFNGTGQVRNRSKGYELLSCLIGVARMYQLTGRGDCLAAAVNAWHDISANRLYLAGSSGADECFKDDHCLPAESGDGPAETWVTAHWIFLSRVLFEITGHPRYADAIEIALYNYLLASQRPQDCHQSYNTPMNGVKAFNRYSIWSGKPPCCISSAMREIARTPESVWTKFNKGGVGVLLYCQAEMNDTIRTPGGPLPLKLAMQTAYPASGEITIQVHPSHAQSFRLALRVPAWAKSFTARAGGRSYHGVSGSFLNLERRWSPGDSITISMDLNERLIPGGASYPGHFAFMRGPQVLTLVSRGEADTALPQVMLSPKSGAALASAADFLPAGWIGNQAYRSRALDDAPDCALVPLGDASQPGVSREFRTWLPAEAGKPPAAPLNARAEAMAPDRIRISWKTAARDASGFRIERKREDVDLWFHGKSAPPAAVSCKDTAVNVVTPGKTYVYRVCAFNDMGASAWSNEASVTTPAQTAPLAPSGLQAMRVAPTQVNLVWTSHSANEQGFHIERKDGMADEWRTLALRIPARVTSFNDFALEPGRSYEYRVRAYNSGGASAWSNTAGNRMPAIQ